MAKELPMKIVGRRKPGSGLEYADGLQKTLREIRGSAPLAPKGVYRFKTHEEADEWMMKMLARKGREFPL